MSLAKNFQKQLHAQLKIHAAWMPVANTFQIGTYGLVEGGVLRPLGHVSNDFGVTIGPTLTSPSTGPCTFESKGVQTVRTVAGAKVDAFPDLGTVDAKLTFRFESRDSVLFRAAALEHEHMSSVVNVANQLKENADWSKRFRVVSGLYSAAASVVLLASEANTEIAFDANVAALKAIEAGDAKLDFGVSTSSERCFRSVGKKGVIGLSLFRIGLFGGLKLLNTDLQLDESTGWGDELEDDL